MPISWESEAEWVDGAVEKARELGCSTHEADATADILMRFSGAPARVTRLAVYYLEHMTEISEEIARDRKAREKN